MPFLSPCQQCQAKGHQAYQAAEDDKRNKSRYYNYYFISAYWLCRYVFETALRVSFDEKTIFPKYVLDYEVKMRKMQGKPTKAHVLVCITVVWNFSISTSYVN